MENILLPPSEEFCNSPNDGSEKIINIYELCPIFKRLIVPNDNFSNKIEQL